MAGRGIADAWRLGQAGPSQSKRRLSALVYMAEMKGPRPGVAEAIIVMRDERLRDVTSRSD